DVVIPRDMSCDGGMDIPHRLQAQKLGHTITTPRMLSASAGTTGSFDSFAADAGAAFADGGGGAVGLPSSSTVRTGLIGRGAFAGRCGAALGRGATATTAWGGPSSAPQAMMRPPLV